MDIVKLSRNLMYKQTKKNKGPVWLLTEMAIDKGVELSKKYQVDERLVTTSLYLAHTVFSIVWNGAVQQNHPRLSAKFVKPYLKKWRVSEVEQEIIINAIADHHTPGSSKTKIAEVVKNAECFKFVTVEGSLIWLHECGFRKYTFPDAVSKVLHKTEQKFSLLTLTDCLKEAKLNRVKIHALFDPLVSK